MPFTPAGIVERPLLDQEPVIVFVNVGRPLRVELSHPYSLRPPLPATPAAARTVPPGRRCRT